MRGLQWYIRQAGPFHRLPKAAQQAVHEAALAWLLLARRTGQDEERSVKDLLARLLPLARKDEGLLVEECRRVVALAGSDGEGS